MVRHGAEQEDLIRSGFLLSCPKDESEGVCKERKEETPRPVVGRVLALPKRVRMCGLVKRCEGGQRSRALPIESRVFSGLRVSIQSLLKQPPWEPINLSAAHISITRANVLSITDEHTQSGIYSPFAVWPLPEAPHRSPSPDDSVVRGMTI